MKGMYGAMLIALAVFAAIMGGYLLNAETVTSCDTDWEYVTDISGAFEGRSDDMDVEYNPPSNITGWSYAPDYNMGYISAVDYKPTSIANGYPAKTVAPMVVPGTLEIKAEDIDGMSRPAHYGAVVTISNTDPETVLENAEMPSGFGFFNSEVITSYEGNLGAFAARVDVLMSAIEADSYDFIEISLPVGAYPAIAAVQESTSIEYYERPGSGTFRTVFAKMTPYVASYTARVLPLEGNAVIDGQTVPLNKLYIIWGQAQWQGRGEYTDSIEVSLSFAVPGSSAYIEPASGVTPYVGDYKTTEASARIVGSADWTFRIEFPGTRAGGNPGTEVAISGDVYYMGVDQDEFVSLLSFAYAGSSTQGNHWVQITYRGETTSHESTGEPAYIELVPNSLGGIMAECCGDIVFEDNAGVDRMGWIRLTTTQLTPDADIVAEAVRGDGQVLERSEPGVWVADLRYYDYTPAEILHHFTGAYWRNYENGASDLNASVTIALKASSAVSHPITFYGPSGSSLVNVSKSADGAWTVNGSAIGKWPAIELTAGYGKLIVKPVSSFRDFLDYTLLGTSIEAVPSGLCGGGTISHFYIGASSGANATLEVVSTTARINEGGLYLQDGTMDVSSAFPEASAVSLMIGSAAHIGDSVTISNGTRDVVLPIDSNARTIEIGRKAYPINGITFRWYSPTGPSEVIDGKTFAAGIYHNGKTYSAGTVWAEVPGGDMVEVLPNAADWKISLDGVWAPAVMFYEGHNEASSKTQLSDWAHGQFRWNADQFLIVMMGVIVVGGLAGSYFKVCTLADWVVIGLTAAGIWLIL